VKEVSNGKAIATSRPIEICMAREGDATKPKSRDNGHLSINYRYSSPAVGHVSGDFLGLQLN